MTLLQVLLLAALFCALEAQYTPDWESLDSRPLPSWYDQAKFGIFVSWSTFSVPSFGSEWYWNNLVSLKDPATVAFHNRVYGANFTYPEFGPLFTAELFDANRWADIFADSGARYVVYITKHHDGFCNWGSANSWNWNSVDIGPRMDTVALLTEAVRSRNLTMGLYFSQFEWYNTLFMKDHANNGSTKLYSETVSYPQMIDLVNTYKPDIFWSDGDWTMKDSYWGSTDFLAWLYNESPVKDRVVVNDRWGEGDSCVHGGFLTCRDRYNPGVLQKRKWENALTIDKSSWGYNRRSSLSGYMTIEQILFELVSTVSCGGNMLLNVGPTKDGLIIPIYEERLTQIGQWLKINGESIYNTVPWRAQNETANKIWYTSNPGLNAVYAIALRWPKPGNLVLSTPKASADTMVTILGSPTKLTFTPGPSGGISIALPVEVNPSVLSSQWAWVFKLTYVS